MDREIGFLFVENVYYNGKDFVCFNVVANEAVTFDFRKKRKMMKLLFENTILSINGRIFPILLFKFFSLHGSCKKFPI